MGAVVPPQGLSGSSVGRLKADGRRQRERVLAHRYSAEYCSLHLKQQEEEERGGGERRGERRRIMEEEGRAASVSGGERIGLKRGRDEGRLHLDKNDI